VGRAGRNALMTTILRLIIGGGQGLPSAPGKGIRSTNDKKIKDKLGFSKN